MWEALIILFLILLNGFFALSEMAVVSARPARLENAAEQGRRGASVALELAREPARFLSTVQVGITLIGILAGAFGGATVATTLGTVLDRIPGVAPNGGRIALVLVVVAITYLSLIIGELAPKRVALTNPEAIAIAIARPMRALSRIASPIVWFLQGSTELALRAIRVRPGRDQTVTEEEVRSMIDQGARSGVFEVAERDMIEGVLRLADRTVQTVMTPRPEVVWLDPDDDAEALKREIAESGYSRFPVCRGAIDEMIGIVQAKDILDRMLKGEAFDLLASLRQPLVVHEGTSVMKLLELFKGSALHQAVVVDEYGSFQGIATLTDIIEAIAGDVSDAGFDTAYKVTQREDGSWLIEGMLPVDEVEKLLALPDMRLAGDYFTLGGFVLWQLGHVPKVGEAFTWNGVRFEVVDMDGRRVDMVLVSREAPAAGEGTAPGD